MDQQQRDSLKLEVIRARKARGWTQSDLAREAGVSEGPVGRIEQGLKVRDGNLSSILDALGMIRPPEGDVEVTNDDTKLALDLIRKWMERQPDDAARHARMNELTRWIMVERGGI